MLSEYESLNQLIEWTLGLNPCCSGICSLSPKRLDIIKNLKCLNPCCSGICSLSELDYIKQAVVVGS